MSESPAPRFTIQNLWLLQADLILIILSVPASFALRLGQGSVFAAYLPAAWLMLVVAILVKPAIYHAFGLCRRNWVQAGRAEWMTVVLAPVAASALVALSLLAIALLGGPHDVPRSVLAIDLLLALLSVGGVRLAERWLSVRRRAWVAAGRDPGTTASWAGTLLCWLEFGWHVGVMLLLMFAFVPLWAFATRSRLDPADIMLVTKAVLLSTCVVLGVRHANPKRIFGVAVRTPWLWGLLAWAGLSAIWAPDASLTLSWSLIFFLMTSYALILVERHPFRYFMKAAGVAFTIATMGSLMAGLLTDEAVMVGLHEGAWRGIFFHKNGLGRVSVLSLAVFTTLAMLAPSGRRWPWLVLAFGSLINLILSQSATSAVAAASMAFAVGGLLFLRRVPFHLRTRTYVAMLGGVLVAVTAAPQVLPRAAALMSRTTTLAGRVNLWRSVWPLALEHPVRGHGLSGFWIVGGPAERILPIGGWRPSHAHNGYLDLGLELGLVGLVLGLLVLAMLATRSIRGSLKAPQPQAWLFSGSIAVFLLVVNLAESGILNSHYLRMYNWFILSYVSVLTAQTLVPVSQMLPGRRRTDETG